MPPQLFALYDGGLQGLCRVARQDAYTCLLTFLEVPAPYRRQGCGSRLLDYVCRACRPFYQVLYVSAPADAGAQAFFAACGFSPSRVLPGYLYRKL